MKNKGNPIFVEKEAQEVHKSDTFMYYGNFCEVLETKELGGEIEFKILFLSPSSTLYFFRYLGVDQLAERMTNHKTFNKKDKIHVLRYD